MAYSPIDTSLSYTQANKLIRELRPLHLVIPDYYRDPPPLFPMNTELVIDFVSAFSWVQHLPKLVTDGSTTSSVSERMTSLILTR